MNEEKYSVKIIRRDGAGQTKDDYHATVIRLRDGKEAWIISDYLWLIRLKTRRWALDRRFKGYDKRAAKLGVNWTFRR